MASASDNRLRRWALDYRRFHGDPGNPALWEELAAFIETPIPHATGPLLRPVTVGRARDCLSPRRRHPAYERMSTATLGYRIAQSKQSRPGSA